MIKFPIYIDNNSTTAIDKRVLDAMLPYFTDNYGNASSKTHSYGITADVCVKKSKEIIADFINANSNEIIFTSGATESINLALKGVAESYQDKGNHIITSAIEHSAVLNTLKYLEKKGFEITYLPVDKKGFIDSNELSKSIRKETILVSVMTANNEIGTIQDISKIGDICRNNKILFHTDASQAIGKIPFDVNQLNVDLVSFTAHKIYGPKGIGALFCKSSNPCVKLISQMHGGGQENGIRSGTYNVPLIAGFAKSIELCKKHFDDELKHYKFLRDKLYKGIINNIPDVIVNGDMNMRIPNNLNVSFNYVDGNTLISNLKKIAVTSGSACGSETLKTSHVLHALGLSGNLAKSTLRFGIGRFNTEEEIDFCIDYICSTVNNLTKNSVFVN